MKDELKSKVDVGFPKDPVNAKYAHAAQHTYHDQMLRLEALKLAYEVSHKVNTFDPGSWHNPKLMPLEKQMEAFMAVLELAEINFNYITTGKTQID